MYLLGCLIMVLYLSFGAYMLEKIGFENETELGGTIAILLWPLVIVEREIEKHRDK